MFGIHDLWLFILSGLLLNITPGVDTLFIVTHSIKRGFKGGLTAALGIGVGCLVHIIAVTVGLSAIIMTSSVAFTTVKIVGAFYLVYIGVKMMSSSSTPLQFSQNTTAISFKNIFWQGFLTNVLNPKVALFFLAFLPQFVLPETSSKALSMFLLGILFNINGTLWNIFIAWSAAMVIQKVEHNNSFFTWLNKTIGLLFFYLGVKLFLEQE